MTKWGALENLTKIFLAEFHVPWLIRGPLVLGSSCSVGIEPLLVDKAVSEFTSIAINA